MTYLGKAISKNGGSITGFMLYKIFAGAIILCLGQRFKGARWLIVG
jgi:hypothetical protein